MADRSDSVEKRLGEEPETAEQEMEEEKEEKAKADLESTPQNQARPETSPTPPRLTIFYGGSVKVFDGIPTEKVMEIMRIATAAASAFAAESAETKNHESPDNGSSSPALPNSLLAQLCPTPKSILCKMQAEFPIARRHSLQRFLEKRRDRLVNKSPYPSSPARKVESDMES